MSNRLIRRQRERSVLVAAFPEPEYRTRIRQYLFDKFGDKFIPDIGEVVVADDGGVPFYGRFEGGGNGQYQVEGRDFTSIRPLNAGER
jgi:hypothetical protein